LGNSEVLTPSQEVLLRKVHNAVRQLPFDLPANMSMEDLMTAGQKILSTFQNRSFVSSLHEGIGNMTLAWAEFMGSVQAATTRLDANCTGESREATIKTLESFWRNTEAGVSRFFGKVIHGGIELVQKHPNEVKTIVDAVGPLFNLSNASSMDPTVVSGKLSNMTVGMLGDLSKYEADVLFADHSQVCSKFKSLWHNMTALETMLQTSISFLEDTAQVVPQMESLIVALAPDVGDRVMGVVNASMKAALNVTTSALPVTKAAIAAMKAELEECLGCKMPVPAEAGSLHRGPNALVSLALALAAWLAFQL